MRYELCLQAIALHIAEDILELKTNRSLGGKQQGSCFKDTIQGLAGTQVSALSKCTLSNNPHTASQCSSMIRGGYHTGFSPGKGGM